MGATVYSEEGYFVVIAHTHVIAFVHSLSLFFFYC